MTLTPLIRPIDQTPLITIDHLRWIPLPSATVWAQSSRPMGQIDGINAVKEVLNPKDKQ
jgi:hypothetical protein